MSRPATTNHDLYHLYPYSKSYSNSSQPKLTNTGVTRPSAYQFNSPKNDSAKNNIFSTKLLNDSHRHLSKTSDKGDNNRANSKLNNENTPKTTLYPSSNSHVQGTSPRLNNQNKLINDKTYATSSAKTGAFDMYSPASKYGVPQTTKNSESLNLRDTNKTLSNNSASSITRNRKLEINTDYNQQVYRIPDNRAQTTKNTRESTDVIPQNESQNKNVVSKYQFSFESKFSRAAPKKISTSGTSQTLYKNGSSITPKNQTALSNKYQPYTFADNKSHSSTSNAKRYQGGLNSGVANGSTKPGQPKMNNYLNNTVQFEAGSLKAQSQKYNTKNTSDNNNNNNSVSKSIEISKKQFSKTQDNLKPHLRGGVDGDDTHERVITPPQRQSDSRYASSNGMASTKNSTAQSKQQAPNSQQQKNAGGGGLNQFITQVKQGDIIGSVPNRQGSQYNLDTEEGNTATNVSYSKKPQLMLNETKYNNNSTNSNIARTPNSQSLTYKPASNVPRTTTNSDTKSFNFPNRNSNDTKKTNSTTNSTKPSNAKLSRQGTSESSSKSGSSQATYAQLQQNKIQQQPVTQKAIVTNGKSTQLTNPKTEEKKPSYTYYVTDLEKNFRHINEQDYFCQIYREHFFQTYQAMMFCRYLKDVDPKVLASKRVNFPNKNNQKKTLVFDLDETLIHCNESIDLPYDVKLPIKFPTGEIIEAGINIRPCVTECLQQLAPYYEIIVFTASHGCYANVVLDHIDPGRKYISQRLFRESCVQTEEGIYIKDLRVIGNRNMQDIVIVDNAAYSFGYQIENGIPCIPFYDNKQDFELKHLVPYLKHLASVPDLREVNKQTFKLAQYADYDDHKFVLEKIVYTKN